MIHDQEQRGELAEQPDLMDMMDVQDEERPARKLVKAVRTAPDGVIPGAAAIGRR